MKLHCTECNIDIEKTGCLTPKCTKCGSRVHLVTIKGYKKLKKNKIVKVTDKPNRTSIEL